MLGSRMWGRRPFFRGSRAQPSSPRAVPTPGCCCLPLAGPLGPGLGTPWWLTAMGLVLLVSSTKGSPRAGLRHPHRGCPLSRSPSPHSSGNGGKQPKNESQGGRGTPSQQGSQRATSVASTGARSRATARHVSAPPRGLQPRGQPEPGTCWPPTPPRCTAPSRPQRRAGQVLAVPSCSSSCDPCTKGGAGSGGALPGRDRPVPNRSGMSGDARRQGGSVPGKNGVSPLMPPSQLLHSLAGGTEGCETVQKWVQNCKATASV